MRFMKATEAGTQVLRLTEFHSRTVSATGWGYLCACERERQVSEV